ncbi:hypothetical protein CR513_07236, partial [Mucuna pruriens]
RKTTVKTYNITPLSSFHLQSSWKVDSLESAEFPPLSSSKPLYAFDPKIERTLHHLRKVKHTIKPDSNSSDSIWNSENSNLTTDKSNFSQHQEAE